MTSRGAIAAARNAVANASREPVDDVQILTILATGDGPGHLVRALFGDCAFETLDQLGAEHGIARSKIRRAYANARKRHAVVNADLEDEGS